MSDTLTNPQNTIPTGSGAADWTADETELVIREREAFQEALYNIPHGTTQDLERVGRQIFREACNRIGSETSSDVCHRLDDQIAASNVTDNPVCGAPFSPDVARRFYTEAARVADEKRKAAEAAELMGNSDGEG